MAEPILLSMGSGISQFYVRSFRTNISDIFLRTSDERILRVFPDAIPLGKKFDVDSFHIELASEPKGDLIEMQFNWKDIEEIGLVSSLQLITKTADPVDMVSWVDPDGKENEDVVWSIPSDAEQVCVVDCGLFFISKDQKLVIVNNQGLPMLMTYYIEGDIGSPMLNFDQKFRPLWRRIGAPRVAPFAYPQDYSC